MRKMILGLAVSLDNLIEGPNGEYDWCFTDQDYGMNTFLESIDAVFYGRKSYELMVKQEGGLDTFGKKKNYVFTNSITTKIPEVTIVNGDITQEVESIKSEPGKNIWLFGGASLTSSFLERNLIDELWLSVHPIILGKGKPLFVDLNNRVNLELLDTKVYNTGLVSLYYRFKK